jgi:ferric-dicitrate binding protein FerR (iron transport regulator)
MSTERQDGGTRHPAALICRHLSDVVMVARNGRREPMGATDDDVFATTRRGALLAGAGALLLPCGAGAQTTAGSVEALTGTSFAQRAAQRHALQVNSQVLIGDLVETGKESRLGLRLGTATQLKLGAEARVRIDSFIVNAGGVLQLQGGGMLFDRDEKAPSGQISVASPFGLIAVRGTRFFAGPSNGVFGVFVARGSVQVSGAGKIVVVAEGQGTNIATPGAAPSDPAAWGAPRIAAAMASVS